MGSTCSSCCEWVKSVTHTGLLKTLTILHVAIWIWYFLSTSLLEYVLYAIYAIVGIIGVFCNIPPALWFYTLGALGYTIFGAITLASEASNNEWLNFTYNFIFAFVELLVLLTCLYRYFKERQGTDTATQDLGDDNSSYANAPSEARPFAKHRV